MTLLGSSVLFYFLEQGNALQYTRDPSSGRGAGVFEGVEDVEGEVEGVL
jgi:hypothetical protein